MGLDIVELMMEVEDYFGISIPDPEAEKVDTVQAMVDTVARHLYITNNSTELRERIFERLHQVLVKLGLADTPVALTEYISKYISPDNKESWGALQNELGLTVPKPDLTSRDSQRLTDKIKFAIGWKPMYNWSTITFDQFVAAVCANNYNELIKKEHIKNTYEIYIAVFAITVEKTGVDYYDISPEKSFTADLGID